MKVKFKLLEEKLTNQGLELQVSECFYEKQTINKIILKSIRKLLSKDKNDRLFIIKNIQSNEIEFKPNASELIIDSSNLIIFPAKIDFLFAASKIEEVNQNWEIELAFPHAWNGEKVTKIQFSNADEQFKKMIKEDKEEYFFIINKIKNHDFLSATSGTKMLILSANSFQNLERSTLFYPEPLEIFVRNPKNNNTHYLIKCQSDLNAIGLKNYKKIRIVSQEKINDGDIIKFNLANLKDILQRDEEDGILRIDNDYRSFTKIQDSSVVSPQQQAQRNIQKQSKKFLKKYQNEQTKKIKGCQKNLEKYFPLLQQFRDKTNDQISKELIDQKNKLSQKLAEFAAPTQLENKITLLENQIFSTAPDYQNQEKNAQFQNELAKIDQEFTKLTEEASKYQNLLNEYLKEKLILICEDDSQFQKILAKYNVSHQAFFDSLTEDKSYPWLQEDGSIDYLALENYLQEQSSQDSLPNNLGYFPKDLKDDEWKIWNEAQIKKSEAKKATDLGYSPEQWKDPQYQEYKDKNRILADGMIEILQRAWHPPLSEAHKKEIKDLKESWKLAEDILRIQEERILNYHDKDYFKDFIKQELKKAPTVNIDELGIYSSYAQGISEIKKWERLENYSKKVISKIYQVRESKISSLSEAQEQAKKNISKTFQKTKIKVRELHQQHQDWKAKIEKLESVSEILEFEQDLILLLEKINCLCQQQWFPNFGRKERSQIKRAKDEQELIEKIRSRYKKQQNWLSTRQINKFLRCYQELQEKKEPNYLSQAKQLREAEHVLDGISELNDEQVELKETIKKNIDPLSNLYLIRSYQERFNNATSAEEKEDMLKRMQRELQNLTETRELTKKEAQIKKKMEQNFRLIQQEKDTQKFIVFNEQELEIELLTLEEESQEENNSTAGNTNDQDTISQKSLIIFAIVGLLLIFLYRWYRKKKEEDPFW